MLIDRLLEEGKTQKINVFLDMDGTLVEYEPDAEGLRYQPGNDFYVNKRPLFHVVGNVKKLLICPNIKLHILSNCVLTEQKQQKIDWLRKYMPFIELKNIHLICYEEISFTKEEKPYLKGNFINNLIKNGEKSYLIDDDYTNITRANTFEGIEAYHATYLVD